MKRIVTILMVALAITACKKPDDSAKSSPAQNSATSSSGQSLSGDVLKKHLIESETLSTKVNGFHHELEFKDSQYEMAVVGEGGSRCTGSYSIVDQKIMLKESKDDSRGCPNEVCQLVSTPDSMAGTEGVQCGKITYYSRKYAQPAGKQLKINGIEVIVMNATGRTTTKVVVRSGPSKSSQPVKCSGNVPDLFDLNIIARTKDKFKVDQWNNYWYYVHPPGNNDNFGCGENDVWIFGEFAKID